MTAEAPLRVVVLGGTSEIGLAIVRALARTRPVEVVLVGRDPARLQEAADVIGPGGPADVSTVVADLDDLAGHEAPLREAGARLGEIDLVLLCVGLLGGQAGLDASPDVAAEVLRVNVLVAGGLAFAALRVLVEQHSGTLVVLSSVAGERVRASNAFYGAGKAALDGLARGLGDAAAGQGVRTLVVRPGFVVGRMTAGLATPALATTPEAVARATVAALQRGSEVVWVPRCLRAVFAVLRILPTAIWRRLPL